MTGMRIRSIAPAPVGLRAVVAEKDGEAIDVELYPVEVFAACRMHGGDRDEVVGFYRTDRGLRPCVHTEPASFLTYVGPADVSEDEINAWRAVARGRTT